MPGNVCVKTNKKNTGRKGSVTFTVETKCESFFLFLDDGEESKEEKN
jgi:hypothetical protein